MDSVQIAKDRIAYRVAHGGHGISDEDVERRYQESFEKLRQIIKKCDRVIMYDNTIAFKRFAVYEEGKRIELSDESPKWYEKVI